MVGMKHIKLVRPKQTFDTKKSKKRSLSESSAPTVLDAEEKKKLKAIKDAKLDQQAFDKQWKHMFM